VIGFDHILVVSNNIIAYECNITNLFIWVFKKKIWVKKFLDSTYSSVECMPIVHALVINLGQKRRRTQIQVGKTNSCRQWGEVACTEGAQVFVSFGVRGGVGFLLFSTCSHEIPIRFSMGFQHNIEVPNVFLNMFPIAPHFISYPLPWALPFNLCKQPKGGDYNISIMGLSKPVLCEFGNHSYIRCIICSEEPNVDMLWLSIIGQKIHHNIKHIMSTFWHPKVKGANGWKTSIWQVAHGLPIFSTPRKI